jgi:hypothetical protein
MDTHQILFYAQIVISIALIIMIAFNNEALALALVLAEAENFILNEEVFRKNYTTQLFWLLASF